MQSLVEMLSARVTTGVLSRSKAHGSVQPAAHFPARRKAHDDRCASDVLECESLLAADLAVDQYPQEEILRVVVIFGKHPFALTVRSRYFLEAPPMLVRVFLQLNLAILHGLAVLVQHLSANRRLRFFVRARRVHRFRLRRLWHKPQHKAVRPGLGLVLA